MARVSIKSTDILAHDYNRTNVDHQHSDWCHTIYLQENGMVEAHTLHGQNTIPMTEYHYRDLWLCKVPDGTAAVGELVGAIEEQRDKLQQVHDAHEVEHDGSNFRGSLPEWAKDVLDDIRQELEPVVARLPSYWSAGDYLSGYSHEELTELACREDRDAVVHELMDEAVAHNSTYLDEGDLRETLDQVKEDLANASNGPPHDAATATGMYDHD